VVIIRAEALAAAVAVDLVAAAAVVVEAVLVVAVVAEAEIVVSAEVVAAAVDRDLVVRAGFHERVRLIFVAKFLLKKLDT
jgi:hypothetical protein